MESLVLKCNNLNYNIGYKKIFHNLCFEINSGDKILLKGENGAGKSTLLKLILNYKKEKSFEFHSDSKNIISYLGHKNGFYSSLNLEENLHYFNSILPNPSSTEEIHSLVEIFGLQKRILDKVQTFSEGMKRKTGIIRALLAKPSLLLLDEPFNSLDENSVNQLSKILEEKKRFQSLVIISHDIHPVQKIINRIFQISNKELTIA